jgi:hypothetical protein
MSQKPTSSLQSLWRQEEAVRLTVAKSTPYRYSKLLAERVDSVLFQEHPYGRYVAGALIMGLFIHR